MKISCSAKMEKDASKSIVIEDLDDGNIKVSAVVEKYSFYSTDETESIEMIFTPNGFNALVGSMTAMSYKLNENRESANNEGSDKNEGN